MIDQLDKILQAYLNIALEPFTHVSYGFSAFVLLLLMAVVSSWLINIRGSKARKQIEAANDTLDGYGDEADFTDNFAEIDSSLRAIPLLERTWEEYSETLLPPLEEIDDPEYRVYRNTKRPHTFFTRSSLLGNIRPLIESDRLIGIGLVLTFIGLVAALGQASDGFQGNNAEIKSALESLLSTAGAKFLASVGGLGGAIMQSMYQAYIARTLSRELDQFNDKLEGLLSFASQERIAADHFGHAKRQTARLEEMSTEITLALGQQIENALNQIPAQFTTALQPMQESFEKVTEKLSSGSAETLQTMVAEFQTQLTGASNDSMNGVVTQLETLSTTLETTAGSMKAGNDELRGALTEVLQSMKTSSETFQAGVSGSAEAATSQLTQIMDKLEQQQSSTASAINSLIEQFKETTEKANEDMQSTASEQMQNLAGGIQSAVETIIQNAQSSSAALTEKIGVTLSSVGEQTTTKVGEILGDTTTQIDEAVLRLSGSIDNWKEATDTANRSLIQTNVELERHNQGIQRAGTQIFEAAGSFSSASQAVQNATQPLSVASDKVATAASELARNAAQLTAQMTESSRIINQSIETTAGSIEDLKTTWTNHSRHLQGADEQLEKAFNQVTSNLAQSLETLSAYNQRFSEKVGQALEYLGGIVSDLSDEVAEFNSKK